MTVTPLGRLALVVAVGVAAGSAGSLLTQSRRPRENKTVPWETLEGHEGSDLRRTRTPSGWIVESPDGFMVTVHDPDHDWLEND
jgi:hypothetical protein